MRGGTAMSDRVNVVLAQVEGFRQRLHDLQREMEPLVKQYDEMTGIWSKEDERMMKALGMVWSAWWDITETIGFLRAADRRLRDEDGFTMTDEEKAEEMARDAILWAAQRRLRDGDGITADVETES